MSCLARAVRKSLSEEVMVEWSPDRRKEGATQIPREEHTVDREGDLATHQVKPASLLSLRPGWSPASESS